MFEENLLFLKIKKEGAKAPSFVTLQNDCHSATETGVVQTGHFVANHLSCLVINLATRSHNLCSFREQGCFQVMAFAFIFPSPVLLGFDARHSIKPRFPTFVVGCE
ncbi:MAG: hypothetical protein PHX25_04155 [Candidatus Pacebacteria bacterium]|nr:hypothetical protein [Candidatus Paceibacterota bacterium]